MSDDQRPDPALSFGAVAQVYDRARPSYPTEIVRWLVGSAPATVLELGAGTGKLTELLLDAGHRVIATDPLPEMLELLRERAPRARALCARAEQIPARSRSIDVVVCAQSFHWFDHPAALPEIARVLRPGGRLALVWNTRDEGIPWVRKLGRLLDRSPEGDRGVPGLTAPAEESPHFGELEPREFRYWQNLRRAELLDLVRSRSAVAVRDEASRTRVLDAVGALYDDYGRGPDGMQLPYLTRCYRAEVDHRVPLPEPPRPRQLEPEEAAAPSPASVPSGPDQSGPDQSGPDQSGPGQTGSPADAPEGAGPAAGDTADPPGGEDTGTMLIDFR